MVDVHDNSTRSKNMAAIKGKDTKPELVIRKGLHKKGFRFKLHDKNLPGKPDLVLPKYKAVIFVNGCFWHGHNCHLFKWPKTRVEFWKPKIEKTQENDAENYQLLSTLGWKVLIIWECALKGKQRLPLDNVIEQSSNWLKIDDNHFEIQGYLD